MVDRSWYIHCIKNYNKKHPSIPVWGKIDPESWGLTRRESEKMRKWASGSNTPLNFEIPYGVQDERCNCQGLDMEGPLNLPCYFFVEA